jgi:hypothetical protein
MEASEADRVCITQQLCREMRAANVRNADIARVKDLVVVAILTPSTYEANSNRVLASGVLGNRQRQARGEFDEGSFESELWRRLVGGVESGYRFSGKK